MRTPSDHFQTGWHCSPRAQDSIRASGVCVPRSTRGWAACGAEPNRPHHTCAPSEAPKARRKGTPAPKSELLLESRFPFCGRAHSSSPVRAIRHDHPEHDVDDDAPPHSEDGEEDCRKAQRGHRQPELLGETGADPGNHLAAARAVPLRRGESIVQHAAAVAALHRLVVNFFRAKRTAFHCSLHSRPCPSGGPTADSGMAAYVSANSSTSTAA